MGTRTVLTVANPDLSVPLSGFIGQLTAAIDERFEMDICDKTVGSLNKLIPEGGEFISNRSVRIAFFGFCLMMFDKELIAEIEAMVPSLEDVGSPNFLADQFVAIVGHRVNVAIDDAGEWKTEPSVLLMAGKLLPEFLLGFVQMGEDEGRLAMMPDAGDGPDDGDCIYQPSFRDDPPYVVWQEYWNRLANNALFLTAMIHGLAEVPSSLTLFATVAIMRLGTFRWNIPLEEFKMIVAFVAQECTATTERTKSMSHDVN